MMKRNKKTKIVAVDFCCGAGGLTRGLSSSGIQVIRGIDNDPTAKKTYEYNNRPAKFVEKDMRDLDESEITAGINRKNCNLLLAGCVPCQPFSSHTINSNYDRRKSLILQFGRFVERIRPEFVLVENVPGFFKNSNLYRKKFLHVLKKNKYNPADGVINAADYGVPQTRKRYILLASLNHDISLPIGKYTGDKKPHKSVKSVLSKYPRLKAGGSSKKIKNHTSPNISKTNLARLKKIPPDGGNRTSLPKSLRLKCHRGHKTHSDVYGRMSWDKPAPTLTCRCTSISNGRFAHPSQNRPISIREAAALQTFPDKYTFYGPNFICTRHIGNAVPVLMGYHLGKAFQSLVHKKY